MPGPRVDFMLICIVAEAELGISDHAEEPQRVDIYII